VKVFLSWSKPRAKQLAILLRDWLPEVIQQVEPWMSAEDIATGQRWGIELANQLDATSQGLVCTTPESLAEPWLNFEAGALAKSLTVAVVRPILLGLEPSEVTGPLAQFQAARAENAEDMLRLVQSINEACETPLADDRLARAFGRTWPTFTNAVASIPEPSDGPTVRPRGVEDMVGEVLDRVRGLERRLGPEEEGGDQRVRELVRQLTPGTWVSHPSLGVGVVHSLVQGSSKPPMAVVDFTEGRSRFPLRSGLELTIVPEEEAPPF
jgi:TIR domain